MSENAAYSPWLNRPLRAICALCEQPALYILRDARGRNHGGGGDLLDADPHPKGRWVETEGGRYKRLRVPPTDGSGRRVHSCHTRSESVQ